MPLADRKTPPTPPAAPRRSRRRATLGAALAGLAAVLGAGCASTGPFALWRTATDSSLSRGPTDKELGPDNRNFMARWLSPRKPPARDPDAPTLVLGSNGWAPMKVEANPEADK